MTTPSSSPSREVNNNEQWPLSSHANDGLSKYGGRNCLGYSNYPPVPKWPKNARVALNFVVHYEAGGELCSLHGDQGLPSRYLNFESHYDYGSRTGFWTLHKLFTTKQVPVTVFAVGMALERNQGVCSALRNAKDWEIATHGYRNSMLDPKVMQDDDTQREHIRRAVHIHKKIFGQRPVGFYHGDPNIRTRALIIEEGGFLYDSDSYADDLPYWTFEPPNNFHLIIPYTMTETDDRFDTAPAYRTAEQFVMHLKDTLKYLLEEGRAGSPKMMSVGLHCKNARPSRIAKLAEFVDYAKSYGNEVWICTREDIARHWYEHHFPRGGGNISTAGKKSPIMTTSSPGGTSSSPGRKVLYDIFPISTIIDPKQLPELKEIDEDHPTTIIKVRMWTGQRRIVRMNMNSPMIQLVVQMKDDVGEEPFRLVSGFPPKPIEPYATVEEAGMKEAQVSMQKLS